MCWAASKASPPGGEDGEDLAGVEQLVAREADLFPGRAADAVAGHGLEMGVGDHDGGGADYAGGEHELDLPKPEVYEI